MLTLQQLNSIIGRISYKDWMFHVGVHAPEVYYLQIQFKAPDNDIPGSPPIEQYGRKWHLSLHSTTSEIVQTAFSAVKWAEEHEMRELFTYKGQRIFGPHFDVQDLVLLAYSGSEEKRDKPASSCGCGRGSECTCGGPWKL